ncbi:hypothetical protein F2P56_030833 [Juglans regia]|uniref:Uncharacterized protein n=1 Tax=Juglans regia TaxID=51240 RepID=A0A833T0M1_JUGRE|nr:hypothetical protein F2P56_030833 [Juglans regia]
MFFFPSILPNLVDSAFDYTIVSFITALLLLSLLSLCFIFYLRFKSRTLHHLQNFNSLWSVRCILVSFIIFWALSELFRIPFFHRRFLFYLFHYPTPSKQANLCKIQVVLSLGLFEPAFLITLLFLVNVSIKKKTPYNIWAIPFVLVTCLPMLMLQIICVFFAPLETKLPSIFTQSSVFFSHGFDEKTQVLCAYPLLSTVMFGAFGIGYSLCFLLSCWKVLSLAINKGLRIRIYGLAWTVLVALQVQIVGLVLSVFWRPDEEAYAAAALLVFIGTFLCAAVGEGILVIKPIADSLAAGGDCCWWSPVGQSRREEGDQNSMERVHV